MTDEQQEQLKQIRRRHTQQLPSSATKSEWNDIEVLLNLVDSQVAESPAGWIMASVQPDRPQNVLITFENSQQASAFISNLEPCPDAATSMRSACIEKVKEATPAITACRPGSQLGDLMADLLRQLEVITIQEKQ